MDTTIVEFLFGVLAGTISSLLIVKRSGRKIPPSRLLRNVELAPSKSRRSRRQTKTQHVRSRRLHTRHLTSEKISSDIAIETSASTVGQQMVMLSCPSCGLEAPETLMAEHFIGSPSHEEGPSKQLIVAEVGANEESVAISSESESRDSLRHLLQMLVPPRAFGRRHGQRTVDPLFNLVGTIGGSRKDSVQ
jgi:hypothetical protein